MATVNEFLAVKGGGAIPPEWSLTIDMLETYYRQFLTACDGISKLDDILVSTDRNGLKEHPLFSVRDKAAAKLMELIKQLGLSLKAGKQLGTTDVKKATTPLDNFFQQQNQKIEQR